MIATTSTPTLSGPLCISFSPAQTLYNSSGVSQSRSGRITFRPRNLLRPLDYNDSLEPANVMILFNSGESTESREYEQYSPSFKPENYSGSAEHYRYSGFSEHKQCLGSLVIQNECTYEIQQVKGKEKGRTANPTLWDAYFCNHEENHEYPALDNAKSFIANRQCLSEPVNRPSSRGLARHLHGIKRHAQKHTGKSNYETFVDDISTYENFVGQSAGDSLAFLRCLRLISPSSAVTIKPEVLSPSSFTESMASTTSCGTRAFKDCDFAFTVPVAITYLDVGKWTTVYTENNCFKDLTWTTPLNKVGHTLIVSRSENGNVPEWWNTTETSIHNVTETYTMAFQHSTQTRPEKKYLWRFLALNRSDMSAKPCRISVEAPTEHDARRVLAPFFILSLSARLSAQGVCNV